jgi:hypothetical protein
MKKEEETKKKAVNDLEEKRGCRKVTEEELDCTL